SNLEGSTVSLQVQATDAGSHPLTYTGTGLPAGLSINSSTGLITGTVSTGASSSSPYFATVTATDAAYSASQGFTWTVTHGNNHAPTLTDPGNQGSIGGDFVSLQLTASDSDNDALTYSATGLPDG